MAYVWQSAIFVGCVNILCPPVSGDRNCMSLPKIRHCFKTRREPLGRPLQANYNPFFHLSSH